MDLKELTEKELMKEYWQAQELRDGRRIAKLKAEMSRRNKEQ